MPDIFDLSTKNPVIMGQSMRNLDSKNISN